MNSICKIDQLHDATLLNLKFDWGEKKARICFQKFLKGQMEEVQINFETVEKLEMTHTSPWGESNSVNEVRFC